MLVLLNSRYHILNTLGSGGCGQTYLAEDMHMPTKRQCVVKQLKPATSDPIVYQIIKERFQREAAILELLGNSSEQIPTLYAYFTEAAEFYLVQEWVEGKSLSQKVKEKGPFSESAVVNLLLSFLPVLDYVHSQGIIHRDIKPDNIMLRDRDGKPTLIDFGAVKEVITTVIDLHGTPTSSIVIGSPGFMPLEQASGKPVFASDQYSLGLTMIYLLTGKRPQELTDTITGEIVWHKNVPNINPNLAAIIDRAIQPLARDRYKTVREMLEALQLAAAISTPTTTNSVRELSPSTSIDTFGVGANEHYEQIKQEGNLEDHTLIKLGKDEYQILAEFVHHSPQFAVNNDWVFWFGETERGKHIFKVANTGGDHFHVVALDSEVTDFLESSGYLYWMTLNRRIQRMLINGGNIETLTKFAGRWGPLCVDLERIYWLEQADTATGISSPGGIMTMALTGGTVKNLLGEYRSNIDSKMIVDHMSLYWTGDDNFASVYKMPKTGGELSPLSKHSNDYYLRFTCGIGGLLAQDEECIYSAERIAIKRVPKSGGKPTILARVLDTNKDLMFSSIALDSHHIYLAGCKKLGDKAFVGVISRIQKDGGRIEPVLMTSEIADIKQLILHSGYIYCGGVRKMGGSDGVICRLPVPAVAHSAFSTLIKTDGFSEAGAPYQSQTLLDQEVSNTPAKTAPTKEPLQSYRPEDYWGDISFKKGLTIRYSSLSNPIGTAMGRDIDSDTIPFSLEIEKRPPQNQPRFCAISRIDFKDLTEDELHTCKELGLLYPIYKGDITFRSGEKWLDVFLYGRAQGGGMRYQSSSVEGILDAAQSITINLKDATGSTTSTPRLPTTKSSNQPKPQPASPGSSGVGTDKYYGQIIRKDGSVEDYIWINTGVWGGNSFYFAFDIDGKDRREVNLADVVRVDIMGPTVLKKGGRSIKNIWAKAKITLRNARSLDNVYINLTGIGGYHGWYYKTDTYGSKIDDNVVAITLIRNEY